MKFSPLIRPSFISETRDLQYLVHLEGTLLLQMRLITFDNIGISSPFISIRFLSYLARRGIEALSDITACLDSRELYHYPASTA
jgi:hypothetical protein